MSRSIDETCQELECSRERVVRGPRLDTDHPDKPCWRRLLAATHLSLAARGVSGLVALHERGISELRASFR